MTNMIFPGRTAGVGEVLAASDIFVMPSDFEGMPNAMMEAMAAGLPCISTTRSGARDVARDGIEALYYDRVIVGSSPRTLAVDARPRRGAPARRGAAARIKEFAVARFRHELRGHARNSDASRRN